MKYVLVAALLVAFAGMACGGGGQKFQAAQTPVTQPPVTPPPPDPPPAPPPPPAPKLTPHPLQACADSITDGKSVHVCASAQITLQE